LGNVVQKLGNAPAKTERVLKAAHYVCYEVAIFGVLGSVMARYYKVMAYSQSRLGG
jgi:hypothetical protein